MTEPAAVVAPGAIALSIAAALRRSGEAVAILGRDAAAEGRLSKDGFTATHPDGRAERVTGLIRARALKVPARAAFFCVKSGDARRAAASARRFIGKDTA